VLDSLRKGISVIQWRFTYAEAEGLLELSVTTVFHLQASAQKYFEQHVMDEVVQWSGSAPVGEAAREAEASLSERPATGWPCDEGWEPSLAGSDTGATTRVAEVGGPVGGLARQSAEPDPPVAKDGVQTSHDNDFIAGGAPVNRSSHRSTATEAIPTVEQPSADKEQRDGGKEQTRSSRQVVSPVLWFSSFILFVLLPATLAVIKRNETSDQ
jgi:hypothetical protein